MSELKFGLLVCHAASQTEAPQGDAVLILLHVITL